MMKTVSLRNILAFACVVLLTLLNAMFCIVFELDIGSFHPEFWLLMYAVLYYVIFLWVCYLVSDPRKISNEIIEKTTGFLYFILVVNPIINVVMCNQIMKSRMIFYGLLCSNVINMFMALYIVSYINKQYQKAQNVSPEKLKIVNYEEATILGGISTLAMIITVVFIGLFRFLVGICCSIVAVAIILVLNSIKYGKIKNNVLFTFKRVVVLDSLMLITAFCWPLIFSFSMGNQKTSYVDLLGIVIGCFLAIPIMRTNKEIVQTMKNS